MAIQGKFLPAFAGLLLPLLCHASPPDGDLDRILRISGIVAQIEQFPELIKQGMKQAQLDGDLVSKNEFSTMLIRTDDTILPAEIIAEVRSGLRQSLSDDDVAELLDWYRSDLGREINELEEKAGTDEAFERMSRQAPELLSRTERVEFAHRIDEIVGTTELTMSIQEYTGLAVFSAITLALRPDTAYQEIQLFRERMATLRPQLREPTERMVIVSFVYTYLPLDQQKLDRFEAFLERPVTTRFNRAVAEGLGRGLGRSIDKWAEALAQIFANKEQQI
ncbi:MAG TPA: DUF2059 domain-containing protein [Gammaproteobacteria bacterium]|nr:DUF2059 domain-containing protein [Gammaproteobacteria bacterium]